MVRCTLLGCRIWAQIPERQMPGLGFCGAASQALGCRVRVQGPQCRCPGAGSRLPRTRTAAQVGVWR